MNKKRDWPIFRNLFYQYKNINPFINKAVIFCYLFYCQRHYLYYLLKISVTLNIISYHYSQYNSISIRKIFARRKVLQIYFRLETISRPTKINITRQKLVSIVVLFLLLFLLIPSLRINIDCLLILASQYRRFYRLMLFTLSGSSLFTY